MSKSLKYFIYQLILLILFVVSAVVVARLCHLSNDVFVLSLTCSAMMAYVVFVATVFVRGDCSLAAFELRNFFWPVLVLCLVFVIGYMLLEIFYMDMFDISGKSDYVADSVHIDFLSTFLLVGIIVPIAEEIFFRGIFLNALLNMKQLAGVHWAAILISAGVFSMLHFVWIFMPYLFVFGIMLAWCAYRTKSLLPSIVMHSLNNSTIVIAAFFSMDDIANEADDVDIWDALAEAFGSQAAVFTLLATSVLLCACSVIFLKMIFDKHYTAPHRTEEAR